MIKHRDRQRRGFTLIEMMMALVIMSIILLGAFSVVLLAGKAIPDRTTGPAANLAAAKAVDQLTADLSYATAMSIANGNDIEFLVQMLQLRYGWRLPALRQRATLLALQALHACGVLPTDDFQMLTQGYRFLRTVENRLRIERDQPVEALESGGEQLTALARRLGYEGDDAAARLLADYQCQREAIRACYTRWFAREKGEEQ